MEKRVDRIDKKHRVTLRIDEVTHSEIDALSFRHNISLNLFYTEAIEYALDSEEFMKRINNKYKRDMRRGHFTYQQDMHTLRRGRLV
ncbi:hypothetical protein [Paenibacillus sp. Soil522]|uniref:hypothetical protein n=1 Tax=Paenibacillus sp. Soil522 TaxID=1736388 RepID=UPI0006FF834E|nr:hypothetical protein [Paenibacillus sp. Soil522]KRE35660.1 hypothetical protein ASG81_20700 [Paenibacillus sp. Soil522]